jgi:uncharacterized membrane protein YedE/YeeE
MDARAPWFLAGPGIGLVVIGLMWVANRPLGAMGGVVELYDWLRRPTEKAGWRLFFLAGVAGGGLLYALVSGGTHPTFAYGGFIGTIGSPVARAATLVAGGALMGYGARTGGGCTSGHGVCGTALGSPASFVATGTFMAVAIASANLIALGAS